MAVTIVTTAGSATANSFITLAELPWWTRYVIGRARSEAEKTADKLTGLLHFGEGLPGDAPEPETADTEMAP